GRAPGPAAAGTAGPTVTDQVDAQTAEMPHIFVLPLSGMVGTYMRHDEIEKVAAEADKYGPGQIIVLLIDSGGGMVIEGDKIHETMKEVKKRHRVVAWIKRAISAAAFTALHCDEIYFMRVGALGSITMFSGTTSISGRELDAWLEKVGEACKIGGREPIVGQAMVTNPILCSYDRDEDGNVTWYSTLQGEFDLSDEKENLTLNADNALHSKFSDGTADTVEELARCMQLKEWKEEEGTGRKIYENWQRTMKQCVEQKQRLYNDLQNPAGVDGEAMIGNRIKTLTEILKWYDRCYPGMVYEQPNFPPDPEELKRELANLKKQLGDMKKRNR
ncbi:MAG: ATP-dependent Clp protease proteolytic subunit, partial [Phycisphaerales bacterium]